MNEHTYLWDKLYRRDLLHDAKQFALARQAQEERLAHESPSPRRSLAVRLARFIGIFLVY